MPCPMWDIVIIYLSLARPRPDCSYRCTTTLHHTTLQHSVLSNYLLDNLSVSQALSHNLYETENNSHGPTGGLTVCIIIVLRNNNRNRNQWPRPDWLWGETSERSSLSYLLSVHLLAWLELTDRTRQLSSTFPVKWNERCEIENCHITRVTMSFVGALLPIALGNVL